MCDASRSSDGAGPTRTVTVPSRPHGRPAASNTDASRYVVVVLPLVPVTPTTVSCFARMTGENRRPARRARGARRTSAATARPTPAGAGDSATIASAPRRMASAANDAPSARWPRMATKTVPRETARRVVRDARDHGALLPGRLDAQTRVGRQRARRAHERAQCHRRTPDERSAGFDGDTGGGRRSSTCTSPASASGVPGAGVWWTTKPSPFGRTVRPARVSRRTASRMPSPVTSGNAGRVLEELDVGRARVDARLNHRRVFGGGGDHRRQRVHRRRHAECTAAPPRRCA